MRITSGKARGISLASPRGDAVRPATDAARLALFSSLGYVFEGGEVLDLFAGTGSYGLEALSRGACRVNFVEKDRANVEIIKKNASAVLKAAGGKTEAVKIICADCLKIEKNFEGRNFSLIVADPPYKMLFDSVFVKKLFDIFFSLALEETIIVLEAPSEFELPEFAQGCGSFELLKRLGKKSKGKPSQIIFRKVK